MIELVLTRSNTVLLLIAVFLVQPAQADSAAPLEPVIQRFASAESAAVPDFQRHVVPLLGRLGCNGRACHGSFQGRGGFRLSLFGYDFDMDHEALIQKSSSHENSRVERSHPASSLLLQKPMLIVDHEGGQRIQPHSWQHHLLRRWIESGAHGVGSVQKLSHLAVEPAEVVFEDSTPIALRVVATWENGDREDVTSLCRFRTNDDSIAEIDEDGMLRPTGRGDTHVVAFYDNGVTAIPVMRAIDRGVDNVVEQALPTGHVDRLVADKLQKLGIASSPPCSDSEFLRRVRIDMTGTLPTPDEVLAFLADRSADKRSRKVDQLLERPEYAAWWTNKLCDFTGCNPQQQAELGQDLSVQWFDWIYHRLRENVPYDQLVAGIVLATSRREGQTFEDFAAETSGYFCDSTDARFTNRDTMPHYWSRRALKEPKDAALAFAHSFLGIRLQCAQCHKHPWDQWTQEDFLQFSSFFSNVRFGVPADSRAEYQKLARQVGLNMRGENGSAVRPDILRLAKIGKSVPWREVYVDQRKQPVTLSLLRAKEIKLNADTDPRKPIMDWMTNPSNPWFAKSIVNRIWAGYFHIGIVDPPDDLSAANPPSNPALLDWLTKGFIDNGYDMKWLHRQIATSQTYQRSWKPNDTNRHDRRNFSRAIPRRIPAEVVYDALKQVTVATDKQAEVRSDMSRRAIGHLSMRLAGTYAMNVFGKPDRAVNCDCERNNQPTLLQSVFLQNDPLVSQRLESSGWIAEIAAGEADISREDLILAAYLRTVGRAPSDNEIAAANRHFRSAGSKAAGISDLLWALVNTKEFILNH